MEELEESIVLPDTCMAELQGDQEKNEVKLALQEYQAQPPTEDDWQEMTEAIKAAEEYEATPPQQLFNTVKGLTDSEWGDLLQLS